MSRHTLAVTGMVIGIVLLNVRVFIENQMQQVVAKLAPPKTNRPLKNLREALDKSRVRREYERLFPNRARKKFLAVRIVTIAAVLCILTGLILSR